MNIIEAKNIRRSFGKDNLITHVLRGVDVSVAEGEFVAIMGKSGAGKSTLMYQLSVLDTPTSGELFVDQTDVIALSEKERTSFRLNTLGYVFQDYASYPTSLLAKMSWCHFWCEARYGLRLAKKLTKL